MVLTFSLLQRAFAEFHPKKNLYQVNQVEVSDESTAHYDMSASDGDGNWNLDDCCNGMHITVAAIDQSVVRTPKSLCGVIGWFQAAAD